MIGVAPNSFLDAAGTFDLRWIDITTGDWGGRETVRGDGQVKLTPPKNGLWAATLKRL